MVFVNVVPHVWSDYLDNEQNEILVYLAADVNDDEDDNSLN